MKEPDNDLFFSIRKREVLAAGADSYLEEGRTCTLSSGKLLKKKKKIFRTQKDGSTSGGSRLGRGPYGWGLYQTQSGGDIILIIYGGHKGESI